VSTPAKPHPSTLCAAATIADHAEEIKKLFNEPVFVTVVVRNPAHPDGSRDVVVSRDNWTQVRDAVEALLLSTGASAATV
jgi:ATP-dependent helicase YprA (DUF1998 family)